MYVVTGLHKLFKAKKVYIRREEHAKGVSVGREDKWYKGGTKRGQMGV